MSLNMDDFNAAGIAGHLRVGPQFAPPSPFGAPVIQRGPHGASFATRPQWTPEGGFQWWNEQVVGSAPWQPRELVRGVMGLGADSKPEMSHKLAASLDKEAKALAKSLGGNSNVTIATGNRILGILSAHRPFSSASWATTWGNGHRSSQEIRADVQIAMQNARRPDSQPKKAMSSAGESMWDHAGTEVSKRGRLLATKTSSALESAGDVLDSPKKTAAVAVGLGLLALGVYSYAKGKGSGPTIRVG